MNRRTIEVDTHTHTILSGHCWSTLRENCASGAANGLKGLCLTEHGPALPGSIVPFAPYSYNCIPDFVENIRVIPGLEFNIMDFDGHLDNLDASAWSAIRFGIASMHDVTTPVGTRMENTEAYINALQNPYVDILGHPDYTYFPNYPEQIVLAAKNCNKLIEINNKNVAYRSGNYQAAQEFARLCMQHDVRVCVSSDAHFDTMVGQVDTAMAMLDEMGFPDELILNLHYETFMAYLEQKEREQRA